MGYVVFVVFFFWVGTRGRRGREREREREREKGQEGMERERRREKDLLSNHGFASRVVIGSFLRSLVRLRWLQQIWIFFEVLFYIFFLDAGVSSDLDGFGMRGVRGRVGAGHLTLVFSLWFFFLDGRKRGEWRDIVGNAIIFLPT